MVSAFIIVGLLVHASQDSTVIRVIKLATCRMRQRSRCYAPSERPIRAILADSWFATSGGRSVLGPKPAVASTAFGPCARTWRLDFSTLRTAGRYPIEVGDQVADHSHWP